MRRFVKRLVSYRLRQIARGGWHDQPLAGFLRQAHIQIHGVNLHRPDWGHESRSLALTLRGPVGGTVQLMINVYWEALAFEQPPTAEGARWRRLIDTSLAAPDDIREGAEVPPVAGPTYLVQPRSIVYLFAQPPG